METISSSALVSRFHGQIFCTKVMNREAHEKKLGMEAVEIDTEVAGEVDVDEGRRTKQGLQQGLLGRKDSFT